jgi:hypothetical protein
MNITKFSRDRMMLRATAWSVPREYFDPLFNYLVYGYEPGSFWTAVLANDFMTAVQHSHPSNTIPGLKQAVGWIQDAFPPGSYGDYSRIKQWMDLEPHQRRLTLEECRLIYTEQEEIIKGLRGDLSTEPIMY